MVGGIVFFLRLKGDEPTIIIAGSGGGKSPLIIKMIRDELIRGVEAWLDALVPCGKESVVVAGTSYPGWSGTVGQLGYRTLFLWEELFMGVKKVRENDPNKMSLEHCIRALNALAVGGTCA